MPFFYTWEDAVSLTQNTNICLALFSIPATVTMSLVSLEISVAATYTNPIKFWVSEAADDGTASGAGVVLNIHNSNQTTGSAITVYKGNDFSVQPGFTDFDTQDISQGIWWLPSGQMIHRQWMEEERRKWPTGFVAVWANNPNTAVTASVVAHFESSS